MGYIRHHTIVVSSWNRELLEEAQTEAKRIFHREFFPEYKDSDQLVSSIVSGVINSHGSFFIGPDCSKEGWDASDNGDHARKCFIDWIKTKTYEDGSSALRYVELFYGDDEGDAEIINHN
jgi:hypothetical protein